MSSESEKAPPLPPRLQLPVSAQSRRRKVINSSSSSTSSSSIKAPSNAIHDSAVRIRPNELDVVPPPPSLSIRSTGDRNNDFNSADSFHAAFRSPDNPILVNSFHNATTNPLLCCLTTSAATSPTYLSSHSLAPLVHSLSYPNIGSLQGATLLQEIQRQSMHRNSLRPALGYTLDKLDETLQKVQQTASSSSCLSSTVPVLKKRSNDDLIDLDLNDFDSNQTERDLLQMFDPLSVGTSLAVSGDDPHFDSQNEKTNFTSTSISVQSTAEQRRSSSASYFDQEKSKEILTRSNSLDSKVCSASIDSPTSTTSTISTTNSTNTVHLPDNSAHIHKRPVALLSLSLSQFVSKLRRLRAAHPFDDEQRNAGYVIASRLYFSQSDSVGSVRLSVHTPFEDSQQPVVFTCSLSSTVEHVICHLVCGALEKPEFNRYALRLYSLDEYLLPECSLAEFTFVQKCYKRRKTVPLELVDMQSTATVRRYARTADDDAQAAQTTAFDVQPTHFLQKYADVNYEAVRILLDTLDTQCARLLKPAGQSGLQSLESAAAGRSDTAHSDSGSVHALLKNVNQSIKALCVTLDGLETIYLCEALTNLSELYLLCARHRMNNANAQFNVTIDKVHPEVIGSAVITLKKAIYEMIHLYCRLFPTNFDCTLHPVDTDRWNSQLKKQIDTESHLTPVFADNLEDNEQNESTAIVCSSQVQDTLLIKVENVCALQHGWTSKYSSFVLQCELVHGIKTLASIQTEKRGVQTVICARIELSSYIQFDTIPVCALPRECKLVCTLYGVSSQTNPSPPPGVMTTGMSTTLTTSNETEPEVTSQLTPLAITCMFLFDEQRFLQQGKHLLGFWSEKYVEPCLRPLINGPCRERHCSMMVLNISGVGGNKIQFPAILDSMDRHLDWNLWLNGRPTNVNTEQQSTVSLEDDMLYASTIAQRQLHQLDSSTQEKIYQMLTRDPLKPLASEQQITLWQHRHSLLAVPSALPHVLAAVDSWAPNRLQELYQLIESWKPLPALDAMQLLLPDYADVRVRALAVQSLDRLPDDELLDLLPQLVNALCFETSPDCALAWLLFRRALCSVRLTHAFYWNLKDAASSHPFDFRLQIHLQALVNVCGSAFRATIEKQSRLLHLLDNACERLRGHKCNKQLLSDLASVQDFIAENPICLPLNAGSLVRSLVLNLCTYFHSNSLPIKLVFATGNNDRSLVHALYKQGDDLRQDTLTMQMLSIMNKLWLKEGLDLKMITFQCMPTGRRKGFIQMVKNAETLRRIQGERGVTGSFRDNTIYEWLRKHNPTVMEYSQAVLNFTQSCAGYAVATYILGIGDRHNDNIMLTPSGHLFHIDFGKFLGDAQMLGTIRRDRVPFVLTSDMAYVINGGERPNARFQQFIDLCCQAYNILRRHCNLFLSLFSLMLGAGIDGVTPNAIRYVHDALRPSLTESKACEAFNRLISEALRSKSTQINFFIHNLAQMRFSSEMQNESKLSFAARTVSAHSQPRVDSVRVIEVRRGRIEGQKVCFYIIQVHRAQGNSSSQHIARTHKEHFELREKLINTFRLVQLPLLSRSKGTASRDVAEKRKAEIEVFWTGLLQMAPEIMHSDLVYSFLQTLERDQLLNESGRLGTELGNNELDVQTLEAEEQLLRLAHSEANDWQMNALMDAKNTSLGRKTLNRNASGLTGEVKLSLSYRKHSLLVMVMHAKNLQSTRYTSPDTYVKTYLIPDPYKSSKRKTRVCSRNAHPTYLEMIAYEMPLQQLLKHTLCVSIWDYDSIGENIQIGSCDIELKHIDFERGQEIVAWYPLEYKDWRKDYRY